MILVNLLIIVMLALAILTVMIASDEADLDRTGDLRWAGQAMAIARGAEASAITALRRDMVDAPGSDSLDEPWANIADDDVAIAAAGGGGRFTFTVVDAQARFNVNNLVTGGATAALAFGRIAAAAGVTETQAAGVVAYLAQVRGVGDIAQLAQAGLAPTAIARLAPYVTALPARTDINANTAPEDLLTALTGSTATARSIVSLRSRRGGIGGDGATGGGIGVGAGTGLQGAVLPPGATLRSDWYWARADVVAGGARQQLTTLLQRRSVNGRPQVVAVRRWRGPAPLMAPALEPVARD